LVKSNGPPEKPDAVLVGETVPLAGVAAQGAGSVNRTATAKTAVTSTRVRDVRDMCVPLMDNR